MISNRITSKAQHNFTTLNGWVYIMLFNLMGRSEGKYRQRCGLLIKRWLNFFFILNYQMDNFYINSYNNVIV